QALLREQVAGDVFLYELVVWHVLVKRSDHVIAVAPGVDLIVVEFVPVGFGIADQVQPVPGPALAIMRRGEQPIDHFGEGDGRLIGQEVCDFARSRWQADQVEGDAPDERPLIGAWGWFKTLFLELGQDKSIDGRSRPSRLIYRRRPTILHRSKWPDLACFAQIHPF